MYWWSESFFLACVFLLLDKQAFWGYCISNTRPLLIVFVENRTVIRFDNDWLQKYIRLISLIDCKASPPMRVINQIYFFIFNYLQVKGLHPDMTAIANASRLETNPSTPEMVNLFLKRINITGNHNISYPLFIFLGFFSNV